MTSKERVLARERNRGKLAALDLIDRAPKMDGTAVIAEEDHIPAWSQSANYLNHPAGSPVRDEGQVWILLIPHRASDYAGGPSKNRALWGLAHTKDPHKAKPWVASYGTSGLYMVGECATWPVGGVDHVFRNKQDNNAYPPMTQNVEHYWEDLGEVSLWQ